MWNKLEAALVQIQLYKGLFILINFFFKKGKAIWAEHLHLMQKIIGSSYYNFYLYKYRGLSQPPVLLQGYKRALPAGCTSRALFGYANKKYYYTLNDAYKEDSEFYKWFVGLADGESNFTIVLQKDKDGNITGASFRFIIELHVDDIDALRYIKSKLNIGNNIAVYGNSCKLTVIHRKDISMLISRFDRYNLNTTKYLYYLDFKKAFHLYYEKDNIDKKTLINQILKLKNGMNKNRIHYKSYVIYV